MQYQSDTLTRTIVASLWVNWAIALGAIALELFLPRIMPKLWLPFPVFAIAFAELLYLRRQQAMEFSGCTAMLRVSTLTVFWSAAIMMLINILNSRMLLDDYIDWSATNKDIPFITCLIIFPTMIVMSLWVMASGYSRSNSGFRDNEGARVNGVIASLFSREAHYQVHLMLTIAIGLSLVEYWYYFTYYINVSMNTPDVFFFNWMPICFYLCSLYFVWNRYRNIAAIIGPIASTARNQGVMLRYLVISGDRMLLAMNEYDRWDTPAITHLPTLDAANEGKVRKAFENISGNNDFQLKYLYDTGLSDMMADVRHYAVFLPEEAYKGKEGEMESWFSLDQIDRFIKTARLSAELTDEIYRIFTITMAWKTYDAEGRRLYPIKHYRPTFRLRDLKDWTVDYNDISWLSVADNNQDRPFFHARRLWRKITGYKA